MENVVVVVVVTIRVGSLGSGTRCDWENFREARLVAASSLWHPCFSMGGQNGRPEVVMAVSAHRGMFGMQTHVLKLFGYVLRKLR